ncbi:MAG: hypothetical protein AAF743_05390, partial [Planctomycetota bacterium]
MKQWILRVGRSSLACVAAAGLTLGTAGVVLADEATPAELADRAAEAAERAAKAAEEAARAAEEAADAARAAAGDAEQLADAPVADGEKFLRFEPIGNGGELQTSIVSYRNDAGQTVDLIGAVHIGDTAYFQTLNDRFADYDAL